MLLSALATASVRPSGESATPLGVDPAGACVPSATEICSPAFRAATSTTQTALVLAHATNSRAPSRLRTIAFGCSPTVTSPFGASVQASSMTIFAPPQTETNSVWPSAERTHVYGSASRSAVLTILRVLRSIARTFCPYSCVT